MGDVGSSCEELFELSRDTIASASLLDRQDKSGSAALVFPSDHLLNNEGQFQHANGTQQPEKRESSDRQDVPRRPESRTDTEARGETSVRTSQLMISERREA